MNKRKVGYQSVVIGSIRDPFIIVRSTNWVARVTKGACAGRRPCTAKPYRVTDYVFYIRVYGKNGTWDA